MKPARLVGGQWDGERFTVDLAGHPVAAGTALLLVFEGDVIPTTEDECATVGTNVGNVLVRALEHAKMVGKEAPGARSN